MMGKPTVYRFCDKNYVVIKDRGIQLDKGADYIIFEALEEKSHIASTMPLTNGIMVVEQSKISKERHASIVKKALELINKL